MANFNGGVTKYHETIATIYFPEGHKCCDLCPLMETYARKQCRMTGEYLLETRNNIVGYHCPLIEIDNNDMEETNNESI